MDLFSVVLAKFRARRGIDVKAPKVNVYVSRNRSDIAKRRIKLEIWLNIGFDRGPA